MKLKKKWQNESKEISTEQAAKIVISALEGQSWSQSAHFADTSHFTVWKYRQLLLANV